MVTMKARVLAFVCCSALFGAQGFMDQYKAVSSYTSGDYAAALDQFETLLTQNPDDYALNYNAGKAAYQSQEYKAAISYYKHALEHIAIPHELAVQAWFDLGNAYVKLQEWQEALKAYEAVVALVPDHKEALDMIEKIKELLNQQNQDQQKQENNQDQQDNKQDQNDQQDTSQDKQSGKDTSSKNQKKQSENNEQDQAGNDDQSEQSHGSDKKTNDQKDKKNNPKNTQDTQNTSSNDASHDQEGETSDQKAQSGKSSQDNKNKQDLHNKDTKESGQEVGQEGQADKSDKDLKQDRGNKLEDSIPDIQDHERNDSSFDHSASPNETFTNSPKQDNPVAAKSQAAKIDPFSINDNIDKNSPVGKMLQLIEDRDAQASQQLLKMNVQSHRRPGEKNW